VALLEVDPLTLYDLTFRFEVAAGASYGLVAGTLTGLGSSYLPDRFMPRKFADPAGPG
jgi:hypothetical protein